MQAPLTQSTLSGVSYCPQSFSTLAKTVQIPSGGPCVLEMAFFPERKDLGTADGAERMLLHPLDKRLQPAVPDFYVRVYEDIQIRIIAFESSVVTPGKAVVPVEDYGPDSRE